jgi:hypothetical protein
MAHVKKMTQVSEDLKPAPVEIVETERLLLASSYLPKISEE